MSLSPVLANIRQLQQEQEEHDSAAHKDIYNLLIQRKMTHFILHFTKYCGGLISVLHTKDPEKLKKTLVDSMIIALSAANCLQIDLSTKFPFLAGDPDYTYEELVFDYIGLVSGMAKACESLDHLEPYPSRQHYETSVVQLIDHIDRFARKEGLDLVPEIRARWTMVEEKQLF